MVRKIARSRIVNGEELDLELVDESHLLRARAEAFARDCYRRAYGADIKTFARELIVLSSEEAGIVSCVGINMAGEKRFFLEQYLDGPLEDRMSGITGSNMSRTDVAEIGTLATGDKGLCRLTMIGLAGMLKSRGVRYIAFSGNKAVRNTLESIGIPLHFIAKASPERLEGGAEEWGSYYESGPEVVFLDVEIACMQLENTAREMVQIPAVLAAMMLSVLKKGLLLEKKTL